MLARLRQAWIFGCLKLVCQMRPHAWLERDRLLCFRVSNTCSPKPGEHGTLRGWVGEIGPPIEQASFQAY